MYTFVFLRLLVKILFATDKQSDVRCYGHVRECGIRTDKSAPQTVTLQKKKFFYFVFRRSQNLNFGWKDYLVQIYSLEYFAGDTIIQNIAKIYNSKKEEDKIINGHRFCPPIKGQQRNGIDAQPKLPIGIWILMLPVPNFHIHTLKFEGWGDVGSTGSDFRWW